jgi:hypothetical protein
VVVALELQLQEVLQVQMEQVEPRQFLVQLPLQGEEVVVLLEVLLLVQVLQIQLQLVDMQKVYQEDLVEELEELITFQEPLTQLIIIIIQVE